MRKYARRNRGALTGICLVIAFAIAMAPLASAAVCAVLVPVPTVFAALPSAPLPAAPKTTPRSAPETPLLPLRAPPLSPVL